MRRALVLALLLTACERGSPQPADDAGARLEVAAGAAGMIPDSDHASLTGAWTLDTDRACVVPGNGADSRIGVLVDYGDGQGCAAGGTVRRNGERLDVALGACRVKARFDGERLVFPAEVPEACQRLCTGRATLESFMVERTSESRSEAATLRLPDGRTPCAG